MALNYRRVDRDQPFLMPPDMRDWLPPDHLVWFILEVIGQLDTRSLHRKAKRGGTGREGYDPEMLLGLWVYASARGISSSRQIERACSEDVAFRVLCGQDAPDHTVLARFRQQHQDAMAGLFAQVLALCVGQGLGKFGVIAIDGTKIRANASKAKTVTLQRLRVLAAAEFNKAAATDAVEDAAQTPTASDDVPPGLGSGSDRPARIAAAIKDLEEQIEAENTPELEKFDRAVASAEQRREQLEEAARGRVRRYRAAAADGKLPQGRPPVEVPRPVREARNAVGSAQRFLDRARARHADQLAGTPTGNRRLAKRNTTDPQSRIMSTRDGFAQGFNAQLAVSDDGLIIAAAVTDHGNDQRQLVPMMAAAEAMRQHCQTATARTDLRIDMVVADNGYLSEENLAAPGPDRLIAPGRGRIKDGEWVGKPGTGNSTPSAAVTLMRTKLADPANQKLYARRSVTVEPVNGHLKDRRGLRQFARRGLRQFARRGLDAVDAELQLASMTTNLMKLFTTTWKPAHQTA